MVSLAIFGFAFTVLSEGLLNISQSTVSVQINFLRDITVSGGIFAGFFILLAGIQVTKGDEWKKRKIIVPLSVLLCIELFFIIFEHVKSILIDDVYFYYTENELFFSFILSSGIPVIQLLLAIYFFDSIRRSSTDADLSRKLKLLEISMVLILLSAAIIILTISFVVPSGTAPDMTIVIIGQIGYFLSSIFMFLAFK